MSVTLITGPVRSGKSRFAERLAREAAVPVTYVATAAPQPGDPEWEARLAAHRGARPSAWTVVESAGPDAADLGALLGAAKPGTVVIVDSLGTWLAALIGTADVASGAAAVALEATLDDACRALDGALRATAARAILVSEETGWGIVPAYASARVFRDVLGRLHQRLAGHAEHAYLIVGGFAIDLRAVGVPVGSPS